MGRLQRFYARLEQQVPGYHTEPFLVPDLSSGGSWPPRPMGMPTPHRLLAPRPKESRTRVCVLCSSMLWHVQLAPTWTLCQPVYVAAWQPLHWQGVFALINRYVLQPMLATLASHDLDCPHTRGELGQAEGLCPKRRRVAACAIHVSGCHTHHGALVQYAESTGNHGLHTWQALGIARTRDVVPDPGIQPPKQGTRQRLGDNTSNKVS